jgi:tRNA-specific 2-thiouridylase
MLLGGIPKTMVRKLAIEYGLAVADKADSQEICFIGQEGYQDFIERRTSLELRPPGMIQTLEGVTVGEHQGLHRYTIGQRRGLGLPQKEGEELLYVVGFDNNKNSLLVGPEKALFRRDLMAGNMNWIAPVDGMKPFRAQAKIRSRHEEAEAWVTLFENQKAHVQFDEPQRAITPGQAIVLYSGSEVLGGGFIEALGTA